MVPENPKVFVSYSHDSAEHIAWVVKFATDLRAKGIDVVLVFNVIDIGSSSGWQLGHKLLSA